MALPLPDSFARDRPPPEVITNRMLCSAIRTKGCAYTHTDSSNEFTPKDFSQAQVLTLSFKNILYITNLETFTSLVELRLESNVIDRIQNLECLVSLKWLDLSFNKIRKIEGLEALKNLTDLSLLSNEISAIEGLDGCPNLQILSLGRNKISDLHQVIYLRDFEHLKCLNLAQNPLSEEESYLNFIIAYLHTLKYVDFVLVDAQRRTNALEAFQPEELRDLKAKDALTHTQQEDAARVCEVECVLQEEFLNFTYDFKSKLFSEQVVPEEVTVLKDFSNLKDSFLEKLNILVGALRQFFEQRNTERFYKIKTFEEKMADLIAQADARTRAQMHATKCEQKNILTQTQLIAMALCKIRHEHAHTEVSDDDTQSESSAASVGLPEEVAMCAELKKICGDFVLRVDDLEASLLEAEVSVHECIEDAIDRLEVYVDAEIKLLLDRGSDFFRNAENIQKFFHGQLLAAAASEAESCGSAENEDAFREKVLSNKEDLLSVCSSFSEVHQMVFTSAEDAMQICMGAWLKSFFEGKKRNEHQRHRTSTQELEGLANELRSHIKRVIENILNLRP